MTTLLRTPVTPALLRGALDVRRTAAGLRPLRLPASTRLPDDYLARVIAQPSGVRLAFRTTATIVELAVLPTKTAYQGVDPLPDGHYELLVDGVPAGRTTVPGGNLQTVDMTTQTAVVTPGQPGVARFDGLDGTRKDVEIWLPQTETTDLIELRTDASLDPVPPSARPVWLHHGSSISHGSTAGGPLTTWPALAARHAGADLINLGFSGNAMADPFTARAMRDTPADLISVKLGINLIAGDLMRRRVFAPAVHGFLDTIREGHPDTPLLVVSPLLCPIFEATPGPGEADFAGGRVRFRAAGDPADRPMGKLTLGDARDELARISAERAENDPHLHYLDGRLLYGEADYASLPLPDELHPSPAGHELIGTRFAELAFAPGGAFGKRS